MFILIIFASKYKIIYMLRIKDVIKEKGTSVQDVAKIMGISAPALSRAINNNTTVEMLGRIAEALGVEIVDLFEQKHQTGLRCPNCGVDLNVKIE